MRPANAGDSGSDTRSTWPNTSAAWGFLATAARSSVIAASGSAAATTVLPLP